MLILRRKVLDIKEKTLIPISLRQIILQFLSPAQERVIKGKILILIMHRNLIQILVKKKGVIKEKNLIQIIESPYKIEYKKIGY